ncbi:ANTH-domain-containing protein [Wallemia mellicola CBS 633.66]|uniref:ANTH-domain-containing protein n=1 Tax=Wallemia mellicola (strain ATCC MYA-4683 / CBS 633.66) TaxID=671144 RepID=I4Y715_WALMC|nr:ANTH-domain-containing protein [Wallemia mellicola CBS 633.66]EIM19757.1 ANTH-domain-containing protein [Wallemia mellicola CBS 633.66]TIB73708.1 hypothetical protein E3Q23_02906 [Wallemia mellicola]TIB96632.1 ANTH-domain-containing protein [Wallemia mellicola]TIC73566.1 ANTH-domain-containing protein [Wallemia mellicola]|eukprot:XP_006960265.1 ANTH-domain-containing protein [Wallemia mellicola CBS 633.66]
MSKLIKAATKPKNNLPKSKLLEPIISASYTDEATLNDLLRALSQRLREPHPIVVFKSLVIVHSLFRNGDTDLILSSLSHHDTLKLSRVSSSTQNIQSYSNYLDSRIKSYKDLRHDIIKSQTSSRGSSRSSLDPSQRPNQLRLLTVEKGLLREVKHVQKLIDALTTCRFFLDDLEDEITVAALQLNTKDLLSLFSALNEGVINVLESYFEMSKIDATEALKIYRTFCRQTESVIQYLSIARRLHNVLNVLVPNIKHAPLSLYGALKEYLEDPNFEQNRIEYKHNKSVIDGGSSDSRRRSTYQPPAKAPSPQPQPVTQSQNEGQTNKALPAADFLDSIESNQGTNANTFNGLQPNNTVNGFQQMQNPQQPFLQPQNTGYLPFASPQSIHSQFTGFAGQNNTANPYQQQQQVQQPQVFQQQVQQPQQQPFMSPQQTGVQPQITGFHQQAGIQPQMTGFQGQQTGIHPSVQPQMTGIQPQSTGFNPFRASLSPVATGMQSFEAVDQNQNNPMRSHFLSQIPPAKPVTAQKTGSRNPFSNTGQNVGGSQPTQSQSGSNDNNGPTLNSLAFNAFNLQQQQQQQQQFQQQQQAFDTFPSGFTNDNGLQPQQTGQPDFASKKFQPTSSFGTTLEKQFDTNNPFPSQGSQTTRGNQGNHSLSPQSTSQFSSQMASQLQVQPTGNLSPQTAGHMQAQPSGQLQTQPTGQFSNQMTSQLQVQPSGQFQTLQMPQREQYTGMNNPNPFRMSMMK